MDDLIVIILTLVVTVFGIYNQHRKKQSAAAPVGDKQKDSGDFWDMIMDKAGGMEEPDVYEPEVPEIKEEPVPVVSKANYAFNASNEGKSVIVEKKKVPLQKKRKVKIDGEEFSLRKAVIYNEILKRKYT